MYAASQESPGQERKNPFASPGAANTTQWPAKTRGSSFRKKSLRSEFALFSYSFGNYRGEVLGLRDLLVSFERFGIDSFFFTDNKTSLGNIRGWKVVHIPVPESQNGLSGNRVAVKMLKFKGHDVLKPYRYLIHMDADHDKIRRLHRELANGLLKYVQCHEKKTFFASKHPNRNKIQEEVDFMKTSDLNKYGELQPHPALYAWDSFLKPQYAEINRGLLLELSVFVLDQTNKAFLKQWNSIYDILLEWGLRRDQIVFNYALANFSSDVQVVRYHQRFSQMC